MKSKKVAGTLALLFGVFGTHRFYLGQRFRGIISMAFFFFAIVFSSQTDIPIIVVPAIIAFVDALLFFAMPKEEFDERYNKKAMMRISPATTARERRKRNYQSRPATPTANPFKLNGIEHYKAFDYEEAIEDFKQSLRINYDDSSVHFNLACCYSNIEETEESLFHLDKAVELGFSDLKRIHEHSGLSYLRTQQAFDEFVRHQYRLPQFKEEEVPVMASNAVTETTDSNTTDLLQQIVQLGELRDKGILTEQEFELQKRKILPE